MSGSLIETPIQNLHFKAVDTDDLEALESKEPATTALWESILSQNIFTERSQHAVVSQQPPAPGSPRKIDIVVEFIDNATLRFLLIAECKRSKSSNSGSLLGKLEDQALNYAKEYLNYENALLAETHETLPFVYAATIAGPYIRFRCYSHIGMWSDIGTNRAKPATLEYYFHCVRDGSKIREQFDFISRGEPPSVQQLPHIFDPRTCREVQFQGRQYLGDTEGYTYNVVGRDEIKWVACEGVFTCDLQMGEEMWTNVRGFAGQRKHWYYGMSAPP